MTPKTSRLSPLNFQGLIATAELRQMRESRDGPQDKRRAIECWKCPDCDEVYEWESEAEECCIDPWPALHPEEAPTDCPICGEKCLDHREASDCCLWKDFDAATRWAMVDKVEAGARWVDLLQINRKDVTQ